MRYADLQFVTKRTDYSKVNILQQEYNQTPDARSRGMNTGSGEACGLKFWEKKK